MTDVGSTMNGSGEVKMKLWKRLIDYSAQIIGMSPSLQNHSDPALCRSGDPGVGTKAQCLSVKSSGSAWYLVRDLFKIPLFPRGKDGVMRSLAHSLFLSPSLNVVQWKQLARTHTNLQVLKLRANLSAGIGNGIPTQAGLITLWCHAVQIYSTAIFLLKAWVTEYIKPRALH